MGQKYAETASHGAGLCRVGRVKHGCCLVLATRAGSALVTGHDYPKFVLQCVDFWVPYKIGGNDREMTPCGAVLSRAKRGKRDSPCVLAART